jgi:hypothetical protein
MLICRQQLGDVALEHRQYYANGVGIYVGRNAVHNDESVLDDGSGEYDDFCLVGAGLGPQLVQQASLTGRRVLSEYAHEARVR